MRALMKASVVGVLGLMILVSTTTVSVALPPRGQVGKQYCMCMCGVKGGNETDLWWEKTANCGNSNGKPCRALFNGKFYPGTLNTCSECNYTGDLYSSWNCTSVRGTVVIPGGPGGSGIFQGK